MKKNIKAFIAIPLLLICGACKANDTEIMTLLDKYTESVDTLNMNLAKSIWSQKETLSFIQPRGHPKGWKKIKSSFYLGAMANFSERDLKLKDISINMLDDNTAWAEFYWDFNAVFAKDGHKIKTEGRETQIYKKENDGWKIVHVHYSGPAITKARQGF
jgi:ketosteroid isomerase-like protein